MRIHLEINTLKTDQDEEYTGGSTDIPCGVIHAEC